MPTPNASACARILSSPSWAPSSANAVLHERASASRSDDRRPRAARGAGEVLQLRRGVLQRDLRRGRQLAVRGEAVLQRRRGVDQLERRTGRVGLGDRAVRQHRRVRGVELRPRRRLVFRVVAGQLVRVVGRRGDHRQDLPGLRAQRDHGAGVVARGQRVVGGLLHGRVDGQDDAAAAGVAAGDEVRQPAREEPVVVAVEHLVHRPLDAAPAVEHRVEAGDGRVHRAVGVLALEAQPVAGLDALREHLARGADLAALAAVLGEQDALVARVVAVVARLDDLHVGEVRHQQDDHPITARAMRRTGVFTTAAPPARCRPRRSAPAVRPAGGAAACGRRCVTRSSSATSA